MYFRSVIHLHPSTTDLATEQITVQRRTHPSPYYFTCTAIPVELSGQKQNSRTTTHTRRRTTTHTRRRTTTHTRRRTTTHTRRRTTTLTRRRTTTFTRRRTTTHTCFRTTTHTRRRTTTDTRRRTTTHTRRRTTTHTRLWVGSGRGRPGFWLGPYSSQSQLLCVFRPRVRCCLGQVRSHHLQSSFFNSAPLIILHSWTSLTRPFQSFALD